MRAWSSSVASSTACLAVPSSGSDSTFAEPLPSKESGSMPFEAKIGVKLGRVDCYNGCKLGCTSSHLEASGRF